MKRTEKAATWAWDARGWWYRITADGKRDTSRYTTPVDYTANCTHSEQGDNEVCAWCGGELRAVAPGVAA